MRYVSVGRRFVALLIDGIVLVIVAAPFVETTRSPGYLRIELVGARSVIPIVVWLVYFIVMEGRIDSDLGVANRSPGRTPNTFAEPASSR